MADTAKSTRLTKADILALVPMRFHACRNCHQSARLAAGPSPGQQPKLQFCFSLVDRERQLLRCPEQNDGGGMATNWPKRKHLSAKQLQILAATLRLNVDGHRARTLRPLIRRIHERYDALARVELGDTAPATTFSPGWEE